MRPGKARRGLQVLAATALIVVVGMLARPPEVAVPEPFEIERGTPGPRPSTTPDPDPTGTPEPARTRVPVEPLGPRVTIVAADPRTLAPTVDRLELDAGGGLLASEIDDEGRWLAIATAGEARDRPTTVRLVDVEHLHQTPVEVVVPAIVDRLRPRPGGRGFVWVGGDDRRRNRLSREMFAGVVSVPETGREAVSLPPVPLPDDFQPWDLAPLDADRVGLFGYRVPQPPPALPSAPPATVEAPRALADLRLVVVDVAAGAVTADVAIPTDAQGDAAARDVPTADVLPTGNVAWDLVRQRAYVVRPARSVVTAVDLETGAAVGDLPLGLGPAGPDPAVGWRDAVLSADGARLFVGGAQRVPGAEGPTPAVERLPIQVFDLEAGGALDIPVPPRAAITAVSPDSEHVLAVAGPPGLEGSKTLLLLDQRTLEERWRQPIEGSGVFGAEFSADGTWLVTMEPVEQPRPAIVIEVFDAATGEQIAARSYDRFPVGAHPTAAGLVIVFAGG